MARKNKDEGDAAETGSFVAQLVPIYQALGIPYTIAELEQYSDEDLQVEIERLKGAAEKVLAAGAQSAVIVPAKSVEKVTKLILRPSQLVSRMIEVVHKREDKNTGQVYPSIRIELDEGLGFMWHSDYYSFEPTAIRHYGSKEEILGMIKAHVEQMKERARGATPFLSIITQEQFDGYKSQPYLAAQAQAAVAAAIADPEKPENARLLAYLRQFEVKGAKGPKTSNVTVGPVTSQSIADLG